MDRNKVKFIVRNTVSWCVGATVTTVIKQNTAPNTKRHKTELAIGSTAIALMIGDEVGSHTDRWVDTIADMFNKEQTPIILVQH